MRVESPEFARRYQVEKRLSRLVPQKRGVK